MLSAVVVDLNLTTLSIEVAQKYRIVTIQPINQRSMVEFLFSVSFLFKHSNILVCPFSTCMLFVSRGDLAFLINGKIDVQKHTHTWRLLTCSVSRVFFDSLLCKRSAHLNKMVFLP